MEKFTKEEQQDAIDERKKKQQIANIWTNTAMGIAGLWANAFATPGTPPPVALGMAIGMTPLLLGTAIAQTATIGKYADGGVVGGNSMNGDKVPAMVNSGEMILNQSQQAQLFNQSNGKTTGGSGGYVSLNIENLTADDDGLQALEDKLIELESNGRFQFA